MRQQQRRRQRQSCFSYPLKRHPALNGSPAILRQTQDLIRRPGAFPRVKYVPACENKLRSLGLPHGALRLLRSSRFALTRPDAFGAGAFPLRGFAIFQRRFRALNCFLGLPSAGFEGTATTPSRQRGGLEGTSSSLKTFCFIQRDTNDGREANEILRSGSESHADRS